MNNTIYILICTSNRAFLGAFGTRADAEQAGKAFKVPTEVFDWTITMTAAQYISCLTAEQLSWSSS
jgi:hypothetical protein